MPQVDDAARSIHNKVQNMRRAASAARSLGRFQIIAKTDDDDVLSDLLCNLMHLCDIDETDFNADLDRARRNYRAEVQEACWPEMNHVKI